MARGNFVTERRDHVTSFVLLAEGSVLAQKASNAFCSYCWAQSSGLGIPILVELEAGLSDTVLGDASGGDWTVNTIPKRE
jgi:hypothetical protein